MNSYLIFVLTGVGLILGACSAQATEHWGAKLGIGYHHNSDTDTDLNEGLAQLGLRYTRFGLQLDVVSFDYSFDAGRQTNIGAHLTYEIDENWTIGGFYGRQDWFGVDYDFYGLEAQYQDDMVEVEAHIGKWDPAGGADSTLFGVTGRYLLNDGGYGEGPASLKGRYYLTAGWQGVRNGADENMFSIGASAEVRPNVFFDVEVSRVAGDTQWGVMLQTELNDGVTFDPRGWTAGFKAW